MDLFQKAKKRITSFDETFVVPVDFDVKTQPNFNDGQVVSSTIKCTDGQLKHYTFETLKHRVNLTYNYGTKQISQWDRKIFPCLSMEDSCKTTSLDSFAYTCDTPKKCVMMNILTQNAKNLQYFLTTVQKESQFFFESIFVNYQGGFAIPD